MSGPGSRRDRIQFPLRALFVFTLLAAVIARVASWLWGLEIAVPTLVSIAVGLLIGLATVLVMQHVELTCLFRTMLFALIGINAIWFPERYVTYGCGVFAGAMIAWKGLDVLNGLFRLCGIMVSQTDGSTQRRPDE